MNNHTAASALQRGNDYGESSIAFDSEMGRPSAAWGRTKLVGALASLASPALWWLNWHTVMTQGHYSIKLTILAPLCLFGGLLMALRPEWSGPWQTDASAARKITTIGLLALVIAVSGVDFYFLAHYRA